jgi:hypothetical protein
MGVAVFCKFLVFEIFFAIDLVVAAFPSGAEAMFRFWALRHG